MYAFMYVEEGVVWQERNREKFIWFSCFTTTKKRTHTDETLTWHDLRLEGNSVTSRERREREKHIPMCDMYAWTQGSRGRRKNSGLTSPISSFSLCSTIPTLIFTQKTFVDPLSCLYSYSNRFYTKSSLTSSSYQDFSMHIQKHVVSLNFPKKKRREKTLRERLLRLT